MSPEIVMTRTALCLAVVGALMVAPPVEAQKKAATAPSGKKLYRWVDKNGNVHFDDALPAEAVDQARTEFNAKTGSATGTVNRALTPEEMAAQAAQQQSAAAAAEQARQEQALLQSYQTEDDLRRAYGERISLLKQTLESTDVGLKSIRGSLSALLAEASTTELENKKVDAKRAAQIRDMHSEMVKQQGFQAQRQAELLQLDGEFQRMLQRFRELHAPAPAPTAGATAAPATGG